MLKSKFCLFVGLLGVLGSVVSEPVRGADAPQGEESLSSPYFVDELHCEGLRPSKMGSRMIFSKDQLEAINKVEDLDNCEKVFRIYGIEKYNWLSPEDLEKVVTLMRQSDYFEEIDLSIKKSELKNHVHVFMKAKPKSKLYVNLDNQFKYYSGYRIYNKLQGEIVNRGTSPGDENHYGVILQGTGANGELNSWNNLGGADQSRLQGTVGIIDLYWKKQGKFNQNLSYDFGLDVFAHNTNDNRSAGAGVKGEFDFFYNTPYAGPFGRISVGPSLMYVYNSGLGSTSNLLPGAKLTYMYGEEFSSYARGSVSYFNSTVGNSVMDLNGETQFRLTSGEAWYKKFYFQFGAGYKIVRNALLPEDLIYLSSPSTGNIHVGVSQIFAHGTSKSQISLQTGTEYLSSAVGLYYGNSLYAALNYKLMSEKLNLNLSLGYYNQRTF